MSYLQRALRLMSHTKNFPRQQAGFLSFRQMSSQEEYKFETLKISRPEEYVVHVEINRPEKLNAMNSAFWREMVECFQKLNTDTDCRAVVISGSGRLFTAGLDLADLDQVTAMQAPGDTARKAVVLKDFIKRYQESFTSIEKCRKPVIAAVHNACVGGGVDLITACDIRYCTQDAWFQIKEVEIGLAADVGTLQRLPKVVGNDSLVRELAFTARRFMSDEAKEFGLVSRVFQDKESMMKAALNVASSIASQSPVAVQGTKVNLVYSRDHSVAESLEYMTTWNMGMLQTEDVMKAVTASMEKKKPEFSKL